jgi:glycosyltransferase involved in cell wall biosynthesis
VPLVALRVLIVLTSNDRRGAEVEGSQLCDELRRAGLGAQVVALRGGAQQPIDVEALGSRPLAPGVVRALRRRAAGVDVVVAFGSSTLPACALALLGTRTPFVYRSIGDPARWVRGRIHRWRTGLLFRRAAHVVALWPAASESIGSLYGVAGDRRSCIPNARPRPTTVAHDRSMARNSFDVPADAQVVAWVGSLSSEKRPVAAVEAVAATPDSWLLMAGEGPLADDVRSACERLLPGRHRLVGVVSPLDPLWAAADVVLLTSATEGMPGVLIEAALRGVPAVAVHVGAVADVVLDGATGRVLTADASPHQLAAALAEVHTEQHRFGAAARDHAIRFTWPVVAPQWVDLLSKWGKPSR